MRSCWPTLVIALGLVPACDRVFGLPAPPDAPFVEHRVTGTLQRQLVVNDVSGAAVYGEDTFPAGRASAIVAFPDRTQLPVGIDEDGAFSFVRPEPDTPYRFVVFADNQVLEVQHAGSTLGLRVPMLGRPNSERTPVTLPTIVSIPQMPGSVVFASTGLWSATPGIPNAANWYVDWRTSTSLWGRRGLLRAEQGDLLYALGYEVVPGTSQVHVGHVLEAKVEMVDGQPLAVPDAARPTSPNVCAHLTAALAPRAAAFQEALPAFGGLYQYWHLQSLPAFEIGLVGAMDLAYGQIPVGSDIDVVASAENPFRGADTTAVVGAYLYRHLTYPGAYPTTIYAAMRHTALLATTTDCEANAVDVTPRVGVPSGFALDDVSIELDGASVDVERGGEAILTWKLGVDGPVDRYAITLHEVFEDASSGLTTTRAIRSFQTVEPVLAIDSTLLIPGAYYVILVNAQLGYGGARDGDLGTVTAPVSTSYAYTGMFQVQ